MFGLNEPENSRAITFVDDLIICGEPKAGLPKYSRLAKMYYIN